MKKILIITFLFFQSQLNAEEYVGSVILSDSTIYTFELNLIINKENITGYSLTNYGTNSETKSSIEGTFDKTKNKSELSKIVAEKLAKKAQEKKIIKIYFDRGLYKYHGRIKALAESAREAGLEF